MEENLNNQGGFHLHLENWDRIDPSIAKFCYELAEKSLNATTSSYDTSIKRADSLMRLIVPLLIALAGYSLSSWTNTDPSTNLMYYGSITTTIVVFISLLFVLSVYLPSSAFFSGKEPQNLFSKETFVQGREKMWEADLFLLICEDYQDRINENKRLNLLRLRRLSISIFILLSSPLIGAIAEIIAFYSA